MTIYYVHSSSGIDVLRTLLSQREAVTIVAQDPASDGSVVAAVNAAKATCLATLKALSGVTFVGKRSSTKALSADLVTLLTPFGAQTGDTVATFIAKRYAAQPSPEFESDD